MSVPSNQGSLLEHPPIPRPVASGLACLAALARGVPPLLIFTALGGLLFWGHHTGWAVPKFSALYRSASAEKEAWCAEHGVPESICVECNEALLPRLPSSWCRVHGVHNCPFEHPEVVQVQSTPEVTAADLDRARRALELKERPENSSKCKTHQRRIQFAAVAIMDKMGIDVAPVSRDTVVEMVPVSGEITYEQPRVAPLYTPVVGRLWEVTPQGQLGEEVKKGDVLALIDAAEVGKAKAEFLQAIAQLDLKTKSLAALQALAPQGAIPVARLREGETAARAAQVQVVAAQQALANLGLPIRFEDVKDFAPEQLGRHLQFLGLPAEVARRLELGTATANLLAGAFRDGIVTEARVVAGEMTDPSKTLFVVADTRRMWLRLNVRAEDVKYLRVHNPKTGAPGQSVRFRPDGSGREVTGELVWKSTTVDEKTRTVQFRANLPNADGALLAHTFGTGRVILREEKDAVVVPSEAVHWEGDCHVVFVRDKNFLAESAAKVFHVRSVRPGVDYAGNTEIIAGVLPGEVVATRNSAALRAELLKNNLGAG